MSIAAVNLIVALPAEAKPLRRHFGLRRDPRHSAFPIHAADDIRLIISGPGKCRAAAACGYLSAARPAESTRWLNIGIAGHADAAIGETVLIDEVIDRGSGRQWQLRHAGEQAPTRLHTLDKPTGDYPDDALIDMEAAGVLHALTAAQTPIDTIHIIKTVSDNRHHPAQHINAALCEQLIAQAIVEIEKHLETTP